MSTTRIPRALRQRIADQAKHRCGSCLTAEQFFGIHMEIDHIVPEALGGPTSEDNLWLACSPCNTHKGSRIAATDPETEGLYASLTPDIKYGVSILRGPARVHTFLGSRPLGARP
ncbi:MAG: hypothetical protein OJF49_004159 [Ktedonobacterales bacterium]|nr:MAG: hypothetical protein OJF49_004159 [Ktedonobacterales bacterium]